MGAHLMPRSLHDAHFRADGITADWLMVKSGLVELPAPPAPLAGCHHGRLWIATGEDTRAWVTVAKAREAFKRHALAVWDANAAHNAEAEAHHRRWERDLITAINAHKAAADVAGPLFRSRP